MNELYERFINTAMDRALLFTFDGSFLTAKEGYVSKEDKKLYFYMLDSTGKRIDMYKSRQINNKSGVIRNRSMWFFWDNTELHKKRLAEKAALIFIDHYRDRYDKLQIDMKDCSNNIEKLVDIVEEIKKESKDGLNN
ncbi:MAG: hypothetical protein J6U54_17325 [Clostridiales bacterium]|nr:hypothetical protein [Clostridiales bacterium]